MKTTDEWFENALAEAEEDLHSAMAERDRLQELAEKNEQAADALWKERDRLREALEKIASMPLSASWQQHFFDATEIAQSALREENSTEEQFVSVADRLNARQETIHTNLPGQRRAEAERMEEK